MTIWRMRIACSIPKATNTHSKNVILIDFPPQRWLHKRASVLRYTYIACLVIFKGRTLSEAVSRRPVTTETRLWSQASFLYDMWWKTWHSFSSESFDFPLSVALHQYYVLSYQNELGEDLEPWNTTVLYRSIGQRSTCTLSLSARVFPVIINPPVLRTCLHSHGTNGRGVRPYFAGNVLPAAVLCCPRMHLKLENVLLALSLANPRYNAESSLKP